MNNTPRTAEEIGTDLARRRGMGCPVRRATLMAEWKAARIAEAPARAAALEAAKAANAALFEAEFGGEDSTEAHNAKMAALADELEATELAAWQVRRAAQEGV